jgi:xylulose-5-phosphate/fructose-6-phosphate phosphoketolase
MLNDLDRYRLVIDMIDRVPTLGARAAGLRQEMVDARLRASTWTRDHGADISRWRTERGPAEHGRAPARNGC